MSHFTLQIGPNGPLMDAFVAVSEARRNALTAAGQPIPNVIRIRALVDTGASGTCVDPSVPQGLGLTPTGSTSMVTPSTGATPHTADQYDVAIVVPCANAPPLVFQTVPVACVELLASQGFHALIGRDILNKCILHYNGTTALFTIAY
jgi:hypothetical protein